MIGANFSFVEPGVLAGSAHPRRWGVALTESLKMLAEEGIKAVVSLDELGLDPGLLQEYQMEYLHSPIVDFSVPTLQQAMEVVRFIERCAEREKPVLVHCAAGIGRTGTMLACWFVSRGMSALEAIRHVRKLRPFSIETPEQEQFVQSFEEHIRSGA